jgi:hypothetical protein
MLFPACGTDGAPSASPSASAQSPEPTISPTQEAVTGFLPGLDVMIPTPEGIPMRLMDDDLMSDADGYRFVVDPSVQADFATSVEIQDFYRATMPGIGWRERQFMDIRPFENYSGKGFGILGWDKDGLRLQMSVFFYPAFGGAGAWLIFCPPNPSTRCGPPTPGHV